MTKMIYPKNLQGLHFGEWEVIKYTGDRKYLCRCSCGAEQIISRDTLVGNRTHSCKKCSGKAKRINLTNKIFGELEVIGYDSTLNKWICKCGCGNIVKVKSQKLRNYLTTCCDECSGRGTLIDISNQNFGEWKVIKYIGDGFWECKCSCGVVRAVHGRRLRNGQSTNCGHIRNENHLIDLSGQHFGEWVVKKHLYSQFWLCECSCGETRRVRSIHLRNGSSTSCGHLRLSIDLTGQDFGRLHVQHFNRKTGKWICKCTCGNIIEVYSHNLRNESTKSCGCIKNDKLLTKEYINDALDKCGEYTDIKSLSYIINRSEQCTKMYIDRYELWSKIKKKYKSKLEIIIAKILDDNKCTYEIHNRSILHGLELDFYIPEYRVAIEVNGNYWHSENFKDKNYHKNKALECRKNNINLINIYEYELEDEYKRDKIIAYIQDITRKNNVIYARNTELCDIEENIAKQFIEDNHIKGALYNTKEKSKACKYKNEIVAVMTIGKPRFNSEYDYEILRFCCKIGTRVVGAASKLLKALCEEYNVKSIISYSDLSKFNGNMYKCMGMKYIGETEPSYVWYNMYEHKTISRYSAQRKVLGYDKNITENEIMTGNDYIKIYDCGNTRFELRR